MNPAVTDMILRAKLWSAELQELRAIVLECDVTEEIKWKQPCYTHGGKNLLIIAGFKEYCALLFFKGVLLVDPGKLLVIAGEPTAAGRQMRFTSVEGIFEKVSEIKAFVAQAIAVEQSGKSMPRRKPEPLPDELLARFKTDKELERAFRSLTPGRQRDYGLHFSRAKRCATRVARIERCAHNILNGFGLADCSCGLSAKMPGCDGSHKYADGNGEDTRLKLRN